MTDFKWLANDLLVQSNIVKSWENLKKMYLRDVNKIFWASKTDFGPYGRGGTEKSVKFYKWGPFMKGF